MGHAYILYGEMGSGKSHKARELADSDGTKPLEGDECMPVEMLMAVSNFGFVSESMTDELVANLVDAIDERFKDHHRWKPLYVAQALYRHSDRLHLEYALQQRGHIVTWHHVKVGFWRNVKQLLRRERGIRWVLYWLLSRPAFQKPGPGLSR
jgi:hypothetical protein